MYLPKPKLKYMLKDVSKYLNIILNLNFFGFTVVSTLYHTIPPTMSSGFYKKAKNQ